MKQRRRRFDSRGSTLMTAALILLPAAGLAAWAWMAISRVEKEMRELGGFEGLNFDIEPRTLSGRGGAK